MRDEADTFMFEGNWIKNGVFLAGYVATYRTYFKRTQMPKLKQSVKVTNFTEQIIHTYTGAGEK